MDADGKPRWHEHLSALGIMLKSGPRRGRARVRACVCEMGSRLYAEVWNSWSVSQDNRNLVFFFLFFTLLFQKCWLPNRHANKWESLCYQEDTKEKITCCPWTLVLQRDFHLVESYMRSGTVHVQHAGKCWWLRLNKLYLETKGLLIAP